jgi:hypothetical protein
VLQFFSHFSCYLLGEAWCFILTEGSVLILALSSRA